MTAGAKTLKKVTRGKVVRAESTCIHTTFSHVLGLIQKALIHQRAKSVLEEPKKPMDLPIRRRRWQRNSLSTKMKREMT
jgi:hypothetical protein